MTPAHLGGATDYPPVWVVVPCHNEARTLPDTLDALASQNGPDLTVLLVDNASTDDTAAVAAVWAGTRRPAAGPHPQLRRSADRRAERSGRRR